MLGSFFVHIAPGEEGRAIIKTGIVKSQVGAERWLLEFQAKGYTFSNVFRAEQLEQFAFFNTPAARQAFVNEIMAANAPPAPEPPHDPPDSLTAEPPATPEAP